METDISLIGIYTSLQPYNSLLVKVRSGGVTNIDITYNQNLTIEDVKTSPEMNKYAMMRSLTIINQMLGVYDSTPEPQVVLYDKSPDSYHKYISSWVSEKLKFLYSDSLLSNEIKGILARDITLWRYKIGAFDYEPLSLRFKRSTDPILHF